MTAANTDPLAISAHPGLGPVELRVAEPPPLRRNLVAKVLGRVTAAEAQRHDTLDHARAAAMVQVLEDTRAAVRSIADELAHLREDQRTLTKVLHGTNEHLRALQSAHDSVATSVGEIHQERRVAEAALAERLLTETGDVRADLARIEQRLAELSFVLERRG